MRVKDSLRNGWLLGLAVLLGSCKVGDSLLPPQASDPGPLTATPIDMHSVQVRWNPVEGARTYHLERRADLKGAFEGITTLRSLTSYIDRDLKPNTIYGYRLEAFNDLGQVLGESPVSGARTAPEPGILVTALSVLGGDPAQSIDSTGYRIRVFSLSQNRVVFALKWGN